MKNCRNANQFSENVSHCLHKAGALGPILGARKSGFLVPGCYKTTPINRLSSENNLQNILINSHIKQVHMGPILGARLLSIAVLGPIFCARES